MKRVVYIFLDEAGNFDFSKNGTPYFILGSLTKERPFDAYRALNALKYDELESGANIEYFHAAEDRQAVRNSVFKIISERLDGCLIDATIIDKQRTTTAKQDPLHFYPNALGQHLKFIIDRVDTVDLAEVIVITDRIPVSKKRRAVEKAVKQSLADMLPKSASYRVLHHDSKSNFDLQIADYCTWAIHRRWTRKDNRSFNTIQSAVRSETDFAAR